MTTHFPGLVQPHSLKQLAEQNYFYGNKLSLLAKWCGFVSAFNIRVKCQPIHIWANTVIIRNSNSLVHCIFNLRDTSCHMYNISSINESPWPRPSFEYELVCKAIVRHNRETIVEPKLPKQSFVICTKWIKYFPTNSHELVLSLLEQKLPTLPEYMSSFSFSTGSCCSIFRFLCCNVL
jgi:hypothetical protein